MYCPRCRAEYREGFEECLDCNCQLVDDLPPESDEMIDDIELTTVLTTDSSDTAEVASHILEDSGIYFYVKGGGFDKVTVGYDHMVGPIRVQVYEEDGELAMSLLEDLEDGPA